MSKAKDDLAPQFMKLFQGLSRAYGKFVPSSKRDARGKEQGVSTTVKEPVTKLIWENHLKGKIGLGVFPLNDESQCHFGAIDIDDYHLDLTLLEKQIQSLGLPLIICKTKSGGAHLYLFLNEPTDAKFVRKILTEWTALLGYPNSEVFPKGDKLLSKNDFGNWLNMPYFGTTRQAIKDGEELTAEEFLALAAQVTASGRELEKLKTTKENEGDFAGGPPCLQILVINGIPEGYRNEGLYNLLVFAKLKYGLDWKERSEEFNKKYINPSLKDKEVEATQKSVGTKNYAYKCDKEPIHSVCNREVCLRRKFGVSMGKPLGLMQDITEIEKIKTHPVTWRMKVRGKLLKFENSAELFDQRRFAQRCAESAANFLPQQMKDTEWRAMWNELLKGAKETDPDPEEGEHGELMALLRQFCTSEYFISKRVDDLGIGKVFEKNGNTYFPVPSFHHWVRKQKVSVTLSRLYDFLRDIKAGSHTFKHLKGDKEQIRVRVIPSFKKGTKSLDVPPIKDEGF